MSLRSLVVWVSAAAVGVSVGAIGCSSTTTSGGPEDSGTTNVGDTGSTGIHDSGAPPGDSTTPPGDSSGGDSGPLACPPSSTSSFAAQTYVPAVAHQGACTGAAIAQFVMACGDNSTNLADGGGSCADWQTSNVSGGGADGGGTGTVCGSCIFAPMNNGATWTDPDMFFSPNYAACIQLTDTTSGSACAAAFNNAGGCEGVACDSCPGTGANDFGNCVNAADQGSCNSYASTEATACKSDFADGGAVNTCTPGAATGKQDPDLTYIATLICGGAAGDAGTD
jgi:hypothetical protein